jgi:hypothetical protein
LMVPAAVSCGSSHHLFRRREHHLRTALFPEPNSERWLSWIVVGKPPRWRSAVVGMGATSSEPTESAFSDAWSAQCAIIAAPTSARRGCLADWSREFDDPSRWLDALREAGDYITGLPKAEHDAEEWRAANPRGDHRCGHRTGSLSRSQRRSARPISRQGDRR